MSLTQTDHGGYFMHQVLDTKMNNIFHVCREKKDKIPAKYQHYRLGSYAQNATGNLLLV
jgi:hypothetical protein